ncbi:MAG TPA: 2-phospho-L-lactate transferase [Myxococcota bacterium]|nr:2-phospho-L-lactate transferase [Myxococcota bacterium]
MRVVALAGGVGAARLLRGLVEVMAPEDLVAVVNTGDDREFYGLHVSPDLDIVSYTLSDRVDREKGYGIAGDSFAVVDALARFGHETWFRLGDQDLATCLHRTIALRAGRGLADVTDELRRALGVRPRILPMSEDPCPTYVELRDGRRLHFEEYLARDGAPDHVAAVDLGAAERARPAPGFLDALAGADAIVVCPSNPVVSIGPILAVPDVRAALRLSAAPIVAVSPIVGGAPVKGPAAQLLRGIGAEVSARGVAALYRDFATGFVFDERDAAQTDDVRALGLATETLDTLMVDVPRAARVASAALELATRLR